MGNESSKVSLKQGVAKLYQEGDIPPDSSYWSCFWQTPYSAEDVFTLLSSTEIRIVRDEAFGNFQTLLQVLIFRLKELSALPFPAAKDSSLNCVRFLTRIFPFIYEDARARSRCHVQLWKDDRRDLAEQPGEADLSDLGRQDQLYLGEQLLETTVSLLFCAGFTLPATANDAKAQTIIWEKGIGCSVAPASTPQIDSNRTEVLYLLQTLCSVNLYVPQGGILEVPNPALEYLVTSLSKQKTLGMLCSLLNTAVRVQPSTGIPYEQMLFRGKEDPLRLRVLQLLPLLINRQPADLISKNRFRYFLSKIRLNNDIHFLRDSLTQVLQTDSSARGSLLPIMGSTNSTPVELVCLLLETWSTSKPFRTASSTAKTISQWLRLLFDELSGYDSPSKLSACRVAGLCVQTLTVLADPMKVFNDESPEAAPYETAGNLLISRSCEIIVRCSQKLDPIIPSLLCSITNVAPHAKNLTASTSMKLMKVLELFATPAFLLANELHRHLLASVLESINMIVDYNRSDNAVFIDCLLKSRRIVEALREFTLDALSLDRDQQEIYRGKADYVVGDRNASLPDAGSSSLTSPESFNLRDADDEMQPSVVPELSRASTGSTIGDTISHGSGTQLSRKARGKQTTTYSDESLKQTLSGTKLGLLNWLAELPLHSILQLFDSIDADTSSSAEAPSIGAAPALQATGIEWTPSLRAWYLSALWASAYRAQLDPAAGIGPWHGASVRLFKIERSKVQGPSFERPGGAIDAIGERLGSLLLRGMETVSRSRQQAAGATLLDSRTSSETQDERIGLTSAII